MQNPFKQNINNQLSRRNIAIILGVIAFIAVVGLLAWAIFAQSKGTDDKNIATSTHSTESAASTTESASNQDDTTSDTSSKKKTPTKETSKKTSSSVSTTSSSTASTPSARGEAGVGNKDATKPKPTQTPPAKQGALLIKHGWDIPYVSYVVNNSSKMDTSPFDGVVLRMDGGLSSDIQAQTLINYSTFKSRLSPLSSLSFNKLKHNFLMVYSTPAGDLFDDWSVPLNNYASMAKAANESGLEGIFFDNEEYFGSAVDFPENCGGGKTVSQCQNQAYLRGQQVMNAIRSTWPDVKLLAAHGPYLSEEKTADYLNSHGIAWNNIAWANQLRGSFAIGMASATVGNKAQFIDGGEVYAARTNQHFKDLKYWQKHGMVTDGSLIPTNLQPHWASAVSSSFGIYDSADLASGSPMNAPTWQTTLTNALNNADHYAWAYTERHDWWGTGWPTTPVPNDWITATQQALNATR